MDFFNSAKEKVTTQAKEKITETVEEKKERLTQLWKENFSSLAGDDGKIKKEDVPYAMTVSGANLSPDEEADVKDKVGEDGADLDKFTELMEGLGDQDEALTQALTEYDQDGTGTINREELKAILQDRGEGCTDEDIDEIFEVADADGSGCLSIKELVAHFNACD